MERLTLEEVIKYTKEAVKTYRAEATYNFPELKKLYDNCLECANQHNQLAEWLEELKSYKDLEEQGLLVRLPCKVGDIVYKIAAIANHSIIPMNVLEIHSICYNNERTIIFNTIGDMGESCYRLEDIGEIVFLTREEAEKKLEEMKAND